MKGVISKLVSKDGGKNIMKVDFSGNLLYQITVHIKI